MSPHARLKGLEKTVITLSPVKNKVSDASSDPYAYPWSNRILIASLLGIALLTLAPFRFDFHLRLPSHTFDPFLLGPFQKGIGILDSFLNVLLFIPLGFGLSSQLRQRKWSWVSVFVFAFIGGALCSYTVEILQFYIPGRNSGWVDVITNSTGSLVGAVVLRQWGGILRQRFLRWEWLARDWLSLRRITLILLSYLGLCFAISIPLQQKTRLSNWTADSRLVIGGPGDEQHRWIGKVFSLQIWDRALSDDLARHLTMNDPVPGVDADALASYDFSASPPIEDQKKFLPPLFRESDASVSMTSQVLEFNGNSELSSKVPVRNLTKRLQKTNQFAMRIVCDPAAINGVSASIVSLEDESGVTNLRVWQEGANFYFWLRNPLSVKRAYLDFKASHVFAPDQMRTILVSYDGSNVSIYVDGIKNPLPYSLGPGAALAHQFIRIKASELEGYRVVYYSCIFVLVGFLLGMAMRKMTMRNIAGWFLLMVGLFVAPVLLEVLLMHVSGRAMSAGPVGFSMFLILLGAVLINFDGWTAGLARNRIRDKWGGAM